MLIPYFLFIVLENESDREFIFAIYVRCYKLICKVAHNYLDDGDAIADSIQNTVIRLVGRIEVLRTLSENQTVSYVAKTAKSAAVEITRRQNLKNKHEVAWESCDTLADDGNDVGEQVTHSMEIEALRAAIRKLPDKYRGILSYKYFMRFSDAEIAEMYGLSPKSIPKYVGRAKKMTYAIMEKDDGNEKR